MIDDSVPWKSHLWKTAANLERRRIQRRWRASTHFLIERELFHAAYAVRKLIEARKLSDEVEVSNWPAKNYGPPTGVVDIMNRDKIDKFYDLSRFTAEAIALTDLCNQFIHSFVFMLSCAEEGGLNGVFVASDRARSRRLLWFDIVDVLAMLRSVAEDEIVTMRMQRVQGLGSEMVVVCKSNGSHGLVL